MEVIGGLVLDFHLYPLHATLAQGTTQDTLHIIQCLLNDNNICDLLRIA